MSQKFTKQELKSPDVLLGKLQGFMASIQKNSSLLLSLIGLLAVGGGSFGLWNYFTDRRDLDLQNKYFVIEKAYLDKKQKFDEAEQKGIPKPPEKSGANKAKNLTAENTTKDAEGKPTGDLGKDYGPIPEDFKKFIKENPQSKSAQMALLNLIEIYGQYNKPEESLLMIQEIEKFLIPKELLSSLILNQYATILANKNECQRAIDKWNLLVANPNVSFLHNEVKLRMGLCYEALGNIVGARQMYSDISKKATKEKGEDSSLIQEADKYLRLLHVKEVSKEKGI